MCIGPYIALILRDLFLAKLDRELSRLATDAGVLRTFRYVDAYLINLNCNNVPSEPLVNNVLNLFWQCLEPLSLTCELPNHDRNLRFLHIKCTFHVNWTCWQYEPQGNKQLLPCSSAHSKLVKRSIIGLCLENTLNKLCGHLMKSLQSRLPAFQKQDIRCTFRQWLQKAWLGSFVWVWKSTFHVAWKIGKEQLSFHIYIKFCITWKSW